MHAIWRFVSTLTTALNRLLALVLCAALGFDLLHVLRHGAPPERGMVARGLELAYAYPLPVAIAVGVLLLLELNLVQFVLFSLLSSPGRAYIESRTPGGQSRIALAAIQNALRATALQVPEIARSKIRVLKLGAHRYRVHIRYWVRDVHEAGNAAEHLRLVLKKRFSDLVVLDPRDRVEFDLDLAGIDGLLLRPAARRELPRTSGAHVSFKGPVYPVEGDSEA